MPESPKTSLSPPLSTWKPPTHLQDSKGVTAWISSFPNLPGIPDDSALNFLWTLDMEPATSLEAYLFHFIY